MRAGVILLGVFLGACSNDAVPLASAFDLSASTPPDMSAAIDMASAVDALNYDGAVDGDVVDTLPPLGCRALIDCTNKAASKTAYQQCFDSATANARALFDAFDKCITNACGNATDDGGSPCAGNGPCVSCVRSGTSSTGMMAGPCSANEGKTAIDGGDPRCGLCVDAQAACYAD